MTLAAFYARKQHTHYFSTVRSEILRLLPNSSPRVLELGCGEGATLHLLKSRCLAQWTCGVDINATALERARKAGVDVVVCGSIDNLELPIEPGSIDLALCLDILEHLADPWSAVRTVAALLRPGGTLVASIPNVQSLRVIAPLLIGRWDYKDCGILDQGHLRFFTKCTAVALLQQAQLTVNHEEPLLERHWLPRFVNLATLRLCQRLVTVQFLLRAVK